MFKITDEKRYVPIVSLSAEGNVKLSKIFSDGFYRPIDWNKCKVIENIVVQFAAQNEEKHLRELLDSSCQGAKRLFGLAYNNRVSDIQVSVNSYKKYFLPSVKIETGNIEIDGGNFYDWSINESIK